VSGAQFAALQNHDQLTPVVNEMPCPLRSDAVHDYRVEVSLHGFEFALRQREIPIMPVADLDAFEAGARKPAALSASRHIVGDALEAEEFEHFRRMFRTAAAQPITGDESSARTQHPQNLREDGRLVRNLHEGILGKNHVKLAVGERQRVVRVLHPANAVGQPRTRDAGSHGLEQRWVDINANHRGRTIYCDEQLVDGAQATANVEYRATGDIAAFEEARDFAAPPGDKSIAPDDCGSACVPSSYSPGSLGRPIVGVHRFIVH
jgi:hypothetical protein